MLCWLSVVVAGWRVAVLAMCSGWRKPYPIVNVGAAPSLSLRAVISVPSGSMASHGNPAGLAQISTGNRIPGGSRPP
jgi:hypothetical protein